MSKEMWDQRYAESEYVYGTSPNEFYKLELDNLLHGKILLPAEGEGRNAVYAAEKGWIVSAFDQSEEGRKKAQLLAASRDVIIDYQIHDLEALDYLPGHFDAIALVFVHTSSLKRKVIHQNLIKFLKPGGTLILIGFSTEQLLFSSGGPKELSMLFSLDELRDDFSDMQVQTLERIEFEVEEGEFHRGKASIIKMVALK